MRGAKFFACELYQCRPDKITILALAFFNHVLHAAPTSCLVNLNHWDSHEPKQFGDFIIQDAVNWLIDHEDDPDIDQMPLVAINMDIESPQPDDITEAIKIKEQELGFAFRAAIPFSDKESGRRKKTRERKGEGIVKSFILLVLPLLASWYLRHFVQERIRAGKALQEAKRIAEENERQRLMALRKVEKDGEKREREKVLKKLEADKLERKRALGLPLENRAAKPTRPIAREEEKNYLPVKSVKKDDRLRECLRSLKLAHKDENDRVKRAIQTLLIYVRNVAKSPDEEKFRKIRLGNPKFQERVGSLRGGIEFLELCGFEKSEGNKFLVFPRDKVDIRLLNHAGSLLNSAMTNPYFGLLEKVNQD
ncbi:putative xyloglucan endotransglucosylase/hydrolase protein 23-like [Hibiscus syriacus]|uniref:Xyloglucan endotransglucosylase/hydrolase protein 23-like n=1 Tax=Hibiscus syriacus TaxID=106335 RepID=A0A6A2Z282_HIBSY|nr:putative xyloglucan endotransglucosylase/hydrolase protein 23-like [Hibiscus syriacus]